jgi:hypothetical protein
VVLAVEVVVQRDLIILANLEALATCSLAAVEVVVLVDWDLLAGSWELFPLAVVLAARVVQDP